MLKLLCRLILLVALPVALGGMSSCNGHGTGGYPSSGFTDRN